LCLWGRLILRCCHNFPLRVTYVYDKIIKIENMIIGNMKTSFETPDGYMISLDWGVKNLEEAKKMLKEWDQRKDSFYKDRLSMKVDKAEKEHLRNCIKFWSEKLDENQST
jgi:hypothetical protein